MEEEIPVPDHHMTPCQSWVTLIREESGGPKHANRAPEQYICIYVYIVKVFSGLLSVEVTALECAFDEF